MSPPEFEPATLRFRVQAPYHSATVPPDVELYVPTNGELYVPTIVELYVPTNGELYVPTNVELYIQQINKINK